MKIMTWNVRGSGSYRKRRSIKEVICKEDPDLVVLQEVKKEHVDRRFVGSLWRTRFKEWLLLPSQGRAGGILVIWDTRRVKVTENLIGDFSISICMTMEIRRNGGSPEFIGLLRRLLGECFGMNWSVLVRSVEANGASVGILMSSGMSGKRGIV